MTVRTYHDLTEDERAKLRDVCERASIAGVGWIDPETLYNSVICSTADACVSPPPADTSMDQSAPNRHERRRNTRKRGHDRPLSLRDHAKR